MKALVRFLLIFTCMKLIVSKPQHLQEQQQQQQYHLDPLNEPQFEYPPKDPGKRTIGSGRHYALGKHIGIHPLGFKYVLGYSPINIKYVPVVKPVTVLKPVLHQNIKQLWKPVLPPIRQYLPPTLHIPKPIHEVDHGWKPVGPPIHQHKPWADEVQHVHQVVEQPVEVPQLLPAVPAPLPPVQQVAVKPIVPAISAHPFHNYFFFQTPVAKPGLLPQVPLFHVSRPQLPVLPLGASFPAPVLQSSGPAVLPSGPAAYPFPIPGYPPPAAPVLPLHPQQAYPVAVHPQPAYPVHRPVVVQPQPAVVHAHHPLPIHPQPVPFIPAHHPVHVHPQPGHFVPAHHHPLPEPHHPGGHFVPAHHQPIPEPHPSGQFIPAHHQPQPGAHFVPAHHQPQPEPHPGGHFVPAHHHSQPEPHPQPGPHLHIQPQPGALPPISVEFHGNRHLVPFNNQFPFTSVQSPKIPEQTPQVVGGRQPHALPLPPEVHTQLIPEVQHFPGQSQVPNHFQPQAPFNPEAAIQPGQTDLQFPLHLPEHPYFRNPRVNHLQPTGSLEPPFPPFQNPGNNLRPSISLEPPFTHGHS